MKTQLRIFGQRLAAELAPLREALSAVGAEVEPLAIDEFGRRILQQARAAAGSLAGLTAKLEDEQAYVVLFGPLKSGKSTLMNAIASTWVSEVSPLPAYPCMVYVSHGDRPRWTITRWNGTVSGSGDARGVAAVLDEAHRQLATALRRSERAGMDFEPARDLPHAIRRIDVRVPAPALEGAGPVLVDTPGLYTRMRFGYDRLTREFRETAAGAIFVVKTENLFLEQIFDEFEDLLRLFSRIFLVVNIDGSKRDLAPDGSLAPSIEARDPRRVLEAFESLAMSSELERARDEGRLSIHAIDLLAAARRRLARAAEANVAHAVLDPSGEAESLAPSPIVHSGGEGTESEVADTNGGAPSAVVSGVVSDGFDRFIDELSRHLDGSEHARLFVADNIRQAGAALEMLREILRGDDLAQLAARADQLDAARELAQRRLKAAARLQQIDWEPHFARQREEVERLTRERTELAQAGTLRRAADELSRWFEDDRSFAALLREGLVPTLAEARDQILETATDVGRRVIGSDVSAAALRQEVGADLYEIDLPLAEIAREAFGGLQAGPARTEPEAGVPARLVPVRRRLTDWLLLRNADRVRWAVLGPDEAPERPVAASVKSKRLAGAAAVLGRAFEQRVRRFLVEALGRSTREVFGLHVQAVAGALRGALGQAVEREAAASHDAETRLARLARLRDAVAQLSTEVELAGLHCDALAAEMGVAQPPPEAREKSTEESAIPSLAPRET